MKVLISLKTEAASRLQTHNYAEAFKELLTINGSLNKMMERATELLTDPERDITDMEDHEVGRLFPEIDALRKNYAQAHVVLEKISEQIETIFHP